jgi:hypothetical protein
MIPVLLPKLIMDFNMIFEVPNVITMKSAIFWDVIRIVGKVQQGFREMYYSHLLD